RLASPNAGPNAAPRFCSDRSRFARMSKQVNHGKKLSLVSRASGHGHFQSFALWFSGSRTSCPLAMSGSNEQSRTSTERFPISSALRRRGVHTDRLRAGTCGQRSGTSNWGDPSSAGLDGVQKYSQIKLQMKREALQLNRQANELGKG